MKKFVLTLAVALTAITINAKTLIVYYSFTNNVTPSLPTCSRRQERIW